MEEKEPEYMKLGLALGFGLVILALIAMGMNQDLNNNKKRWDKFMKKYENSYDLLDKN